MRIKNIAAKVIGIAGIDLLPGSDWTEIDDSKVYVDVFDAKGQPTGAKQVLPSLQLLQKMNQIVYVETPKVEPPQSSDGADAGNGGDGQTMTDEEKKKAEAAAKRAAAKAAKEAAKAAAEAGAGKAE